MRMSIRRHQPEAQLQRAVVEHLRWRARLGRWWTHIPLGGVRSKVEAAILRGLGTTRGTPDLLIIANGRAYFLELKAPHGRISDAQHECHEALRAAGATVAVANNIDEALKLLESWQILRPNLSTQTVKAFQQLRDNVARRAARIRRQTTESKHHE
jgi:VRR-NUC domain